MGILGLGMLRALGLQGLALGFRFGGLGFRV